MLRLLLANYTEALISLDIHRNCSTDALDYKSAVPFSGPTSCGPLLGCVLVNAVFGQTCDLLLIGSPCGVLPRQDPTQEDSAILEFTNMRVFPHASSLLHWFLQEAHDYQHISAICSFSYLANSTKVRCCLEHYNAVGNTGACCQELGGSPCKLHFCLEGFLVFVLILFSFFHTHQPSAGPWDNVLILN